jgi:diguanylate cyclase (GGDEF)-like protein
MNVAVEQRDLDLLGPATELGVLWHEAASRRGSPTLDPSTASEVVGTLLDLMERADAADPLTVDDVARLLGGRAASIPDLDALAALRTVFRERATTRLPVRLASAVVERAEEIVEALVALRVRAQMEALENAAFVDPLTGIGNRRALERDLAREISRAQRHVRPLTIAAIDLDGLKTINDSAGHAAGDEALRRLANAATDSLRDADSIYRVGGDEFVLLLPETELGDVPALLERIKATAPSFSVGVASAPADAILAEDLLAQADSEMIASRRRTRDAGPVVQLPERSWVAEDPPSRDPAPLTVRLRIHEIQTTIRDHVYSVEVTLRRENEDVTGTASGSSVSVARLRIAASATLDALSMVDAGLRASYVDAATVVRVGGVDLALVTLVIPTMDIEEITTGAAPLRQRGSADAVARAVLDALNRRLAMRRTPAA